MSNIVLVAAIGAVSLLFIHTASLCTAKPINILPVIVNVAWRQLILIKAIRHDLYKDVDCGCTVLALLCLPVVYALQQTQPVLYAYIFRFFVNHC